jgi:hypothetical protein
MNEEQLRGIKERAAAAGLGSEFEMILQEMISRENRSEARFEVLKRVGSLVGWREPYDDAKSHKLLEQVKAFANRFQGANYTVNEIRAWICGFLRGIDKEVDPGIAPIDAVQRLVDLIKGPDG